MHVHQIERFEVQNSKKSPQTHPRSFLGFALESDLITDSDHPTFEAWLRPWLNGITTIIHILWEKKKIRMQKNNY